MKFLVRYRKRPQTRREWLVMWLHRTDSSSWWGESLVKAETAEGAASAVLRQVDIDKHTTYKDRRLRVCVYGPIPEDGQEFYVAPNPDPIVTASDEEQRPGDGVGT